MDRTKIPPPGPPHPLPSIPYWPGLLVALIGAIVMLALMIRAWV
jgi:hypothetical protein